MTTTIGRALLAFCGLTSIASTALAQGNTFNPYGNSGYADYREFGTPMYSNNPALPGQALLNSQPFVSRPRANTFQQYSNELEGSDAESAVSRRSPSSSLPYYQSYQRMNPGYDRVYKPNNTPADREFYERQKKREQDYANAIKETDPVKRAKMLRQVELDSRERPSAASRSGASTKGAAASKPGVAASTGTARSSTPPERRLQAPSPLSGDPPRRTGTTSPAGRAPSPSAGRAPSPTLGRSTTAPPPTSRPTTPTAPASDASSIPIPPPR